VLDRLGLPVFFKDEVVAAEIRYRPALSVDDGRDDVDQQDVALQSQLCAQECAREQKDDRRAHNLPAGAQRAKAGSHG
jgi:hypothetical protein